MKIYELECLNEDGHIESNGLFISRENAEISKAELDQEPGNLRYDIKQQIVERETQDHL